MLHVAVTGSSLLRPMMGGYIVWITIKEQSEETRAAGYPTQ